MSTTDPDYLATLASLGLLDDSYFAQQGQTTTGAPTLAPAGSPNPLPIGVGGTNPAPVAAPGPSPAPAAPTTAQSPDPAVEQTRRDALVSLKQGLADWGFSTSDQGTLTDWMWDELVNGRSQPEISQDLYQRPEFNSRFPAIKERQASGLPPISPQQYVTLEQNFQQIASATSLPPGFWDSKDDFHHLIANDWNPQEFKDVITQGYEKVNSQAPPAVRQWFSDTYGVAGDSNLAALFIDADRAGISMLQQHAAAAQVGGLARGYGFSIGARAAEDLTGLGLSEYRLNTGLGQAQGTRPLLQGTVGEGTSFTDEQAVNAAFGQDGAAAQALRARQQGRIAEFAGGGGSILGSKGFAGLGGSQANT